MSLRRARQFDWTALLLLGAVGCTDTRLLELLPRRGVGGSPMVGVGGASTGGSPPFGQGGETAGSGGGGEAPGRGALLHRYDFSGSGVNAFDLVGDADGEMRGGAALDGTGQVRLDGVDDYVALPGGLLGGLDEVTFVSFLSWRGPTGRCWQRVFDFGRNDSTVPGEAGNVTSSVFVTASTCPDGKVSAGLDFDDGSVFINGQSPLSTTEPSFVALALGADERLLLFVDGELVAGEGIASGRQLAEIEDQNNWLGRSQWIQDQTVFLAATYDEFRIYGRALETNEVRELFERGPDSP